jgi:phosphoserine phosphatase
VAILDDFCRKLGIDITECVCVGDGDNDIELFKKTKHGVTFKGSKIESEAWKTIDNLGELDKVI